MLPFGAPRFPMVSQSGLFAHQVLLPSMPVMVSSANGSLMGAQPMARFTSPQPPQPMIIAPGLCTKLKQPKARVVLQLKLPAGLSLKSSKLQKSEKRGCGESTRQMRENLLLQHSN
uniref:Uncharacterized protein n=1 Tax=Ditylenchus dipsaci TaxID=166011 RepID=A0A915D350_9BILA